MRKTAKPAEPEKVDKYIASQPRESREELEKLRTAIKAAAPGAEEVISYGMPAFKYEGRMLVGFANYKNHIGFYPWDSKTVTLFKNELKGLPTSVGAIQLVKTKPIPVTLIKKIVKTRMKENLIKNKKK